jgi:hypothetical protein
MTFCKVKIGDIEFFFEGANFVEAAKEADVFKKDIASRIRYQKEDEFVYPKRVKFRSRENDGGNFQEFVVYKEMGDIPATKRVSRHMKYEGKPLDGYFIAFSEPWVRYNKEESRNEVMYDSYQLENEEVKELGFDEAGVWIPAERVETKTKANPKKHYLWKPL